MSAFVTKLIKVGPRRLVRLECADSGCQPLPPITSTVELMPVSRKGQNQPTWDTYQSTIGDRSTLFSAIRDAWAPSSALYLGSYLDLSPSTAIPEVTYVDTDRRVAKFFGNEELLANQLRGRCHPGGTTEYLQCDYTSELPLKPRSFDLLISLFSGPVWDTGSRYVADEGLFLANNSHGDASLAALDPRLRLVAAVTQDGDVYRLEQEDLGTHLVPKNPDHADPDRIRNQGRGIAFVRMAFAYVFRYTASSSR